MATGDELYQQLLKLKNKTPTAIPQQSNNIGPSQKASLSYRDSVVNALRSAPSMDARIKELTAGKAESPTGALGNIGKLLVNNPVSKVVLSGLDTIDKPKRFVISGIKEFVDAVDGNAKTKSSFTDFKSQISDPLFGFGRVVPRSGWGGRIIGLIGDLALDPINWLTLGGAIAPRAGIKAASLVAREVGERVLLEGSEELIAGGAQKLGANIAKDFAKVNAKVPTNTREFLGVKSITGRSGASALAEGARKFGASDEVLKDIFKRNRLGVPDDLAKLMGLNDYGLTMFGSRVKLPYTGTLAKGLASNLTKGRLGIVNTEFGGKIMKALTPGGTAEGFNLRDIRFALRAGKELPSGLTPKMASAILASETSMRGAKGIAANQGAQIIRRALENSDVVAEQDTIYRFLDKAVMPVDATPRQLRAMNVIKQATDTLYANIESYGMSVGGGNPGDFQIAPWRERFFPHKMTQAARDFVDNNTSDRAVQVRQYMKVDHSNIGGSFESRNLERAVNNPNNKVNWFGTELTKEHIDGGVETLNQLARDGGFKGDFFETNINRALTSYLENYAEGIGTIAFYQGLKEAGEDIGGMAVSRGMISKEALDGLLTDIERSQALVSSSMNNAIGEGKKTVDAVIKELSTQRTIAAQTAQLTPEQTKLIREGTPASTFVGNIADAKISDDIAKKVAIDNLTIAKNNIASRRAELSKARIDFMNKLETESIALRHVDAQHRAVVSTLDNIGTRITSYIDELKTVDEFLPAMQEKAVADLKVLNDELNVLRSNATADVDTLGRHSMEFINDAMKTIQSYALGDDYSGVVKDLQELATAGKIFSGKNRNLSSRGIASGLGTKDKVSNVSRLLRMQTSINPGPATALDDAWVELRNSLGILQETQIAKGTFRRLEQLTIADVRATLSRAMSSADPTEIGGVRDSITWLMMRSQLDDPRFASEMLTNPTKEFEAIKVVLNNARIREKFAINAIETKVLDGFQNVVDIDQLPAKLKGTAKAINLYNERNLLDSRLETISEHLLRVPDVDRNPIYDTVYQVLSSADVDSIIPSKLYKVLADEIKRINPVGLYENDNITTSFIKGLEDNAVGSPSSITVQEFLAATSELFPAPLRKNLSNDLRLSAEERALYITPPMAKLNVSLRTAILQKQRLLSGARQQANEKMIKQLSKLDAEAKAELATVLNTEEMAQLVGTNLADDAKNLARSAANFYLDQETKYVLKMADATLSPHGVALTQEGHAQLMNQVYGTFIEAQDKHLINLYGAEYMMRDIANSVLNSGLNADDAKLSFIENVQKYLRAPSTATPEELAEVQKSRQILIDVFPELVVNLGRRQSTLKTEAAMLASSPDYRKAIEQLADFEIKYFAVGRGSDPSGASLVSFMPAAQSDEAAKNIEQGIKRVEQNRRLRESTMGSPELQKQQLLAVYQQPSKHSTKLLIADKIAKRFEEEIIKPMKQAGVSEESIAETRKAFNGDYELIKRSLNGALSEAKKADKELKELAIAAGGPKAGRRRTISREVVRQGQNAPRTIDNRILELSPNSVSVRLSQMLSRNNHSLNPIKEFFGTIMGGDEFAVATARGSEAARINRTNTSFRVIRREESFFGKTIPAVSSVRDDISKRLYSSDPTTSEFFAKKVEYANYLKGRLDTLEAQIKDRPQAMKMLDRANKELAAAEKASGGLSVEKRLEYIDSLSVIAGDAAPFSRVWDTNTNDWKIVYTKNYLYKFPEPKSGKPPLQGPLLDKVMAAKGLPVPKEAFTEMEKTFIKQYLTAFEKHSQFIKSEEYAFALREYSQKEFINKLTQYDLSKIDWTINGDTSTARAYSREDLRLISNKVVEQFNSPTTAEDFFIEPAQKISNLGNLFTKNKQHLIQRMEDTNKPPLIFIDPNGRELNIVLQRTEDGVPTGLFEQMNAERIYEPFNPKDVSVTVIDPAMVDDIDTGQKTYKRLRLTENDGMGTMFDPTETWVKHNPVLDPNKDVAQQRLDNPPYYKRASEYLPQSIEVQKLKNFDGEDFAFTAIEQESLYTDFNTPTYKGIRGVTGKAFGVEAARKEKAVRDLQKTLRETLQGQQRGRDVKLPQQTAIKVVQEKLQIAEKELNDYLKAAELWDAHFSANRKVAHLYNVMTQPAAGEALPASRRAVLQLGDGSPQHAIGRYLKAQATTIKGANVNAPDELVNSRKLFNDEQWAKTYNSKIIQKETELKGLVDNSMQGFANTDLNVVKNILKSRQQIGVVGAADGLRADMERMALAKELQGKGITFAEGETPTLPQLRAGVKSIADETEQALQARTMVQEVTPGANLKALIDAQTNLDRIPTSPQALEANALQSEVNWMKGIKGEINEAITTEVAKGRVLTATGKDAGILSVGKLAKARQDAIDTIKATMSRDPFEGRPSEYLTMTDPDKEIAELVKAQKAFDAATILHTDLDVGQSLTKIDEFDKAIKKGRGIKKSLQGKLTNEQYDNFNTEFQLFKQEVEPMFRLDMDDEIRNQLIKFADAHLEYMRQVASLSEAERINSVVQGLGKSSYYGGAAGSQELREGRLIDESVARDTVGKAEWLTHFDDGMVRLGKQFPNIQVAPQIAEFVQNVHRLQEPAIAMELNRFLGKYTRFFKAYATLSPGFHARNAMSNGFMLFAAGGNARFLTEGMRLSSSLNEASRAGKSVQQWIASLPLEQQSPARIAVRASAASGGGDAADRLRNLYMSGRILNNKLTQTSRGLGTWIEGHSRFMLAYDGARQGMDFNTAAARVQRFLIDYNDVSTVDKSLRQIIPFWMWTSRNLPMQVQNIWLNPKAYQAYGNFKRNFTDQDENNQVVPTWMQEMGAWKLPFGQNLYATPDLGFSRLQSDINMLQDPRRLLSNVNPLLRLPIELTGEKQLFSNKRFSQTPVEVQSFPGTAIQPLLELMGYGETGPGGQKFVNDKAYYALRNLLPMLSRAESISPSIQTDPNAVTSNPLYGFLGLPVKELSQKMQDSALKGKEVELQNLLRNYRATNNPQG